MYSAFMVVIKQLANLEEFSSGWMKHMKHHEAIDYWLLTISSEINISPGQFLFSVHILQFTQLRAWLPFWTFSATCCLLPSFVPFSDLRFGGVHVFCARSDSTRPMPTGSFPSALHRRDLRSLVDSQWHLPVKPPLKLRRDWELSPGDKWHTAMAPSLDTARSAWWDFIIKMI